MQIKKIFLLLNCILIYFLIFSMVNQHFVFAATADTPTPTTNPNASSNGSTLKYRTEAPIDVAVGTPPAGSGSTGGSNIPPNDNTCIVNGVSTYALNNPMHKNFGDPNCEFANNKAQAEDNLKTYLKQIDPNHATQWFEIFGRESSYNPNAWASPATGTPDQGGAWGLPQMGQGSATKPYDKGNVYWKDAANDAVQHLRTYLMPVLHLNTCAYWQAAKDLGYCFTSP